LVRQTGRQYQYPRRITARAQRIATDYLVDLMIG
jgi:hypothetical protein